MTAYGKATLTHQRWNQIPPRNAACREFLMGFYFLKGSLRDVFISRSALNG
jgi:hypothetical protein